jgi:hypothetical protein
MTIPVKDLVTDALYSALVGDSLIDFPNMAAVRSGRLQGAHSRLHQRAARRQGVP